MPPPLVIPALPVATPRERLIVVSLVLALHVGVAACWLLRAESPVVTVNEMSVSVAMRQTESVAPRAETEPPAPQSVAQRPALKAKPQPAAEQARPSPLAPPHTVATSPAAEPQSVPVAVASPAMPASGAAAPVADSEPDFRAAYLDNPRPPYPMAARRMGWQGRVVLNVEVLAEGRCGGINVSRSSGHEMLDSAALNTVKGWRFAPATHAGHPVTQWFRLPINFSLEGNEA